MRRCTIAVTVLILVGGCSSLFHWRDTVADAARVLARGPVVQNVTANSAVFMGRPTDALLNERITVSVMTKGRGTVAESGNYDAESDTFQIPVGGLAPGVACTYTVTVGGTEAGPFHFRTAPARSASSTTFAIYGDTRTRTDKHALVANAILTHRPDFVLCSGDLVANGTVDEQWDAQFFGPARRLFANAPVFPCLGNHERRGRRYFDLLCLPGNESYYEMVWGPVRVVTVDQYQEYGPGSEQHAWLDKTLAKEFEGWTFVQFHEPPFGANERRGINMGVIEALLPVLYKHQVDMVVNGHDHYYMRTIPLCDRPGGHSIHYIVSGGGGAPIYTVDPDAAQVAVCHSCLHYLVCNATLEGLSFRVLTPEGEELDAFSLSRASPPRGTDWSSLVAPALTRKAVSSALAAAALPSKPGKMVIEIENPLRVPYTVGVDWQLDGTAWNIAEVGPLTIPADGTAKLVSEVTPPGKDKFYPVPTAKATITLPERAEPAEFTEILCAPNRPIASVASVRAAPVVDGVLDEACWKNAQDLSMWKLEGTGRAKNSTVAHVVAGPDAFYVGVECAEDDMSTIFALATKRDGDRVWADDCVEVLVDPSGDGTSCFQFIVSVNAVQADTAITLDKNRRCIWNSKWNATWAAATKRSEHGWTAEIRIPWQSLGFDQAPAAGASFGFNVTRSEQNPDPKNPGRRLYEVQQWAVTFAGNCAAYRFGTLKMK